MGLAESQLTPPIEEEGLVLVDRQFLSKYQHDSMHPHLAVLPQKEDDDQTLSLLPSPHLNDHLGMLGKVAQD